MGAIEENEASEQAAQDEQVEQLQRRLQARASGPRRLVFWEDPEALYAPLVARVRLEGAEVLDATGHELAAKRLVLRERPDARFVVYRAGAPLPQQDLLLDVKLMAEPFSCAPESLWAEECGLDARLAESLRPHAAFFASKKRRQALAASGLPKSDASELRLAMLAACARSTSPAPRDAVRDAARQLLSEHAHGKDETLRSIARCGLEPTWWNACARVFGYRVEPPEQPSLADLALRMVQTRCGDLVIGGPQPLSPDAVRVLDDLARDPRTAEDARTLARNASEHLEPMVPPDRRKLELLARSDALPAFDQWILKTCLGRAREHTLPAAQMREIETQRTHTLWFDRYRHHYACLSAAVELDERLATFERDLPARSGAADLFRTYCADYYQVDRAYRLFCREYAQLPVESSFKRQLGEVRTRLLNAYDDYLVRLTDRWQMGLGALKEPYPPADLPAQDDFFAREVLALLPAAQPKRRVGVVVSDALRYEVGVQLARELNESGRAGGRGKVSASCEGALGMLPSYTQLGMAALLPEGPLKIDPSTQKVSKGGQPTDGTENRARALAARLPGSVAVQAARLLEGGIAAIAGFDEAPVVYVYHDVVDKRGDDRATEREVFQACDEACAQLKDIVSLLLSAGCGTVLVTADHGFLYQDHDLGSPWYLEVEDLAALEGIPEAQLSGTHRFLVGKVVPDCDELIVYTAAELSLVGDYFVLLPKTTTRLRRRGGGSRYVHGGASLQENVVPVVKVKAVHANEAARPTDVQCFLAGRPVVTGATVACELYQMQPVGERTLPVTARVGLYAPQTGALLCTAEQTFELASPDADPEKRRKRVVLPVTNDADDHDRAVLRVSVRVGATNQYKTVWEQELEVNRAFGNDFDF